MIPTSGKLGMTTVQFGRALRMAMARVMSKHGMTTNTISGRASLFTKRPLDGLSM